MPLTARERFKVNVLGAIADRGLTVKEARAEVQSITRALEQVQHEKEAAGRSGDLLSKIPFFGSLWDKSTDVGADWAKTLGRNAIGYGYPIALAAPAGIGMGLGYAASKATDIDDDDIEAQKKRELIALYNAQTQQLGKQ